MRIMLAALSLVGIASSATAADVAASELRFFDVWKIHERWPNGSARSYSIVGYHLTSDMNEIRYLSSHEEYPLQFQKAYVFNQPTVGTVPLYRYRSRTGSDHFFTTSETEGTQAITRFDYIPEAICCYIFDRQEPGTIPLFRMQKGSLHKYLLDPALREALRQQGWHDEGITGYVLAQHGSRPAR